jgi:hypothetical protein
MTITLRVDENTFCRAMETVMGITDPIRRSGRSLVSAGRDVKLHLGDLFGQVQDKNDFEELARDLCLSRRTVNEYRHTARICTPPVRELIADSGVLVCYSVLREGAHAGPSGVPHDESFRTLCRLISEAPARGSDRISVPHYQREIGIGPSPRQLAAAGDSRGGITAYLDQFTQGREREEAMKWVKDRQRAEDEQRLKDRRAISSAFAAQSAQRRERERENKLFGLSDPQAAREFAFTKRLVEIGDKASKLMSDFAGMDLARLSDERNATAVTMAIADIEAALGCRVARRDLTSGPPQIRT